MSDTEIHTGKLIPTGHTLKTLAEHLGVDAPIESLSGELPKKVAELTDYSGEYIGYKGNIYKVSDKYYETYDFDGAYFMQDDGTINYVVSFYNGGCGFTEALEDLLP